MGHQIGISTPLPLPLPKHVEGVSLPVIDLNERSGDGTWEFFFGHGTKEEVLPGVPHPYAACQDVDPTVWQADGWKPAVVPGELVMQGFDIENNREYYYRRTLRIPEDYGGRRVMLRFEGVYSNARCWIGGHFIRSHAGGFTSWDCDITEYVRAGQEAVLVVGIADLEGDTKGIYNPDGVQQGDPSWGSRYAHHNIGGILRDVMLYALPRIYVESLHVDTHFDRNFRDGILEVEVRTGRMQEEALEGEYPDEPLFLDLSLTDAKGHEAARECVTLRAGEIQRVTIPVSRPKHWDAEHPYLYTLSTVLRSGEEILETLTSRVGFREIHYGGRDHTDPNKLYVNGKEVKLRGTCRHDVSCKRGRSTTREEDWEEIRAYRAANINHIRTSHYPPSRHLLDACDELGMYVEEENSVCFQGANGYGIHAEPEAFVKPFLEMTERDRNRPCVIIWSLGNESGFEDTPAFRIEYELIRQIDRTRPVIFSYPYTVRSFPLPYDIYSRHYENCDGVLGGRDMPVLHDEFAHIACYNLEELKQDPGVRNFWGRCLKDAWERIFGTDGALGCDLWGGIDDVFPLPDGMTKRWQSHSDGAACGYGQWGSVLDCYRREKPEAYLTKKAYSPVRLNEEAVRICGEAMYLPVENWFDHANFNELTLIYTVDGSEERSVELPDIRPHEKGMICLRDHWEGAGEVNLIFRFGELVVDEFRIPLAASSGAGSCDMDEEKDVPPVISDCGDELVVEAGRVRFCFSKTEACLKDITCLKQAGEDRDTILLGGPYLHLSGYELPAWERTAPVYAAIEGGKAVVGLYGRYGKAAEVLFVFRIGGDGSLSVEYQLLNHSLYEEKLRELGIAFDIPADVCRVDWNRKGLYSVYPKNHIGREKGSAERVCREAAAAGYGAQPAWDWKDDMYDSFLYAPGDPADGRATRDFLAMKENILDYTVSFPSRDSVIRVESNGDAAARVALGETGARLIVDLQWSFPDLGWGNTTGTPVRPAICGGRGCIGLRIMEGWKKAEAEDGPENPGA